MTRLDSTRPLCKVKETRGTNNRIITQQASKDRGRNGDRIPASTVIAAVIGCRTRACQPIAVAGA